MPDNARYGKDEMSRFKIKRTPKRDLAVCVAFGVCMYFAGVGQTLVVFH